MRIPSPVPMLLRTACVAVSLLLPLRAEAQRADAQRAAVSADCDYRRCAYNIIAALHGLRVVRGAEETQVATLGFLWTGDVSSHFDGEGRSEARSAVRARRWGALLTDVGLALLLTGATRAAINDLDDPAAHLMIAGVASVGVSVPVQFLADKHLARAVWQHNARYAAESR